MVTSGKGGVGKSTVSCGCAVSLAHQGKKVLLIDGDIGLRSLDTMLGTSERTVYHWEDVLKKRCKEEDAIIQVTDSESLFLLTAPFFADELSDSEAFREMCFNLAEEYDFIIIDSPAGLGRGFSIAVHGAEEALVVVTPDPVSIHAAGVTQAKLAEANVAAKMLLNRFKVYPIIRRSMPNIDDAIDQTGLQLIGIIPEDKEIAYSAAKGQIYLARSRAVKAFDRVTRRLQGEEIPLKHLVK
mgnify:CR=1 FL=1